MLHLPRERTNLLSAWLFASVVRPVLPDIRHLLIRNYITFTDFVFHGTVRFSVRDFTQGGATTTFQAKANPAAVRWRYLGCSFSAETLLLLQEHYGSFLPEGLPQRPSTGLQPWAKTCQRRCQGEYSNTHIQIVMLTAVDES